MLVDFGIDSVSLNPDSVIGVRQRIAQHEALKTGQVINEKKAWKGKEAPHIEKRQEKAEAQ